MISWRPAVGIQRSASRPVAFELGCCWELGRSHRDRRALKVVDLARVKIDQPQPWTPATLRLGWSQSTDVRRKWSSRVRRLVSAVYRVWRPFAGQAWWPSSQWFRSRDFIRSVKAGRL